MKFRNITNKRFNWKIIIAGGVLGLLAACSATLNAEKIEDDIQKDIESKKDIDLSSVSCPTKVELKEGNTFDCDVQASDGTKYSVTVTQEDSEGKVDWELPPTLAKNDTDTNSSSSQDSPGDLVPSQDPPSPEPEPDPAPPKADPNAPRVDSNIVEDTIKEQFADQAGIPVRSVACPQDVAINVNSTFNCTVNATDGKTINAVVTQTNEQGGFTWNATNGLISYDKVEGLIQSGLQEKENLAVTPSCGTPQTRFIIAYAGEKFKCSATDPNGRNIPIDVSVRSDDGQVLVNWRL